MHVVPSLHRPQPFTQAVHVAGTAALLPDFGTSGLHHLALPLPHDVVAPTHAPSEKQKADVHAEHVAFFAVASHLQAEQFGSIVVHAVHVPAFM